MTRNRDLPVYVSLLEAAGVASVSTRTIRRRISDGTIPAYQLGNGTIRIRLDDVLAAFRRIPLSPLAGRPTMTDHEPSNPADQVIDSARAVEDAARHLCRITVSRPGLTPADVDVVLAHLAAAVAALPQTAAQLGDILNHTKDRYALKPDSLVSTRDADLLIDTARLHLEEAREPAVTLYRHLAAAQNQAAHVVAEDLAEDLADDPPSAAPFVTSAARRPGHEPPTSPGARPGPSMPR